MMKAVVFDLDGTLYDSKRLPLHLIFGDLFHASILKDERKVRKEMAGLYLGDANAVYDYLFEHLAEKHNCSVDCARSWYNERYMPLMTRVLAKHYECRPNLESLIALFHKKGIKVAVFSDYGTVPEKLEALNIQPSWFDLIIDAPTLGGLKPAKESFQKLAQMLQVSCNSVLMVGDRDDRDGAGALSAGMSFVRILNPGANGEGVSWDDFVQQMVQELGE